LLHCICRLMAHFSAVPTALSNVGYRGQIGKHLLALSFTGFDPGRVKTLVLAVNTRILEKCILQLDAVSASSAAVSDSLRKHFRFGCSAHEFSHGLDPEPT
jgi:hypothetical protein